MKLEQLTEGLIAVSCILFFLLALKWAGYGLSEKRNCFSATQTQVITKI